MKMIWGVGRERRACGMGLRAVIVVLLAGLACGCSIERMALNKVGNVLARGGSTFGSDNDPEFVRDSVPFALKLMESLLAENPRHEGLLLATAQGFTQYSYAFVQMDADMAEAENFAAAEHLRTRARNLYLRARQYGLRGLEVRHRGFEAMLRQDPKAAVRIADLKDVPLLFWTAAAWGSAISVSKDQPELIADQGIVAALIDRALELDESFGGGAIHSFLITFEMARPGGGAQAEARARKHFDRAMELAKGKRADALVSLAEAVDVPQQNRVEFEAMLRQALAVDPNALPEARLATLILQRRAQWLLARADDLFFQAPSP